MPDLDFQITSPTGVHLCGTINKITRNAVLWPIVGKQKADAAKSAIQKAFLKLLATWRARVIVLRQAGWSPLQDQHADRPSRAQFARNCPPFGVTKTISTNRCRRPRVCPWCFGREVVMETLFGVRFVNKMFEAETGEARDIVPQVVCTRRVLPDSPFQQFDTPEGAVRMKEMFNRALTVERAVVGDACIGSRTWLTFEPGEHPGLWRVTRCGLFLLKPRAITPTFADTVTVCSPDKAMRYPVRMLRGDPVTTVAILHLLAKTRTRTVRTDGLLDTAGLRATVQACIKAARTPGSKEPVDDGIE